MIEAIFLNIHNPISYVLIYNVNADLRMHFTVISVVLLTNRILKMTALLLLDLSHIYFLHWISWYINLSNRYISFYGRISLWIFQSYLNELLVSFQLKAVAISETNNKFLQLYAYEKQRGPGRFDDLVYLQNARVINNADLFRFECVGSHGSL